MEGLFAFLSDLVRLPSPPSREGLVAERVRREMEALGFDSVELSPQGSVVGVIGQGKPQLLLAGHMDTVDPGPPRLWTHDPYGATVQGGMLFGRGAVDMKGGLAAAIHGAGLLAASGRPPKGSLAVAATVMEEPCEGKVGLKGLFDAQMIDPDWVIIAEPSDMAVMRGQRGRAQVEVVFHGTPAHASSPSLGRSALLDLAQAILLLPSLALPTHPFLGPGDLTPIAVESQALSLNSVPHEARLTLDRRTVVGEKPQDVLDAIDQALRQAGLDPQVSLGRFQGLTWTGQAIDEDLWFPGWLTPADHPLVQALGLAFVHASGHQAPLSRWLFSTDGTYSGGTLGLPTAGFGPGSMSLAHGPDEAVAVAHVALAAQTYAQCATLLLKGQ